jgi:hypothetical protein
MNARNQQQALKQISDVEPLFYDLNAYKAAKRRLAFLAKRLQVRSERIERASIERKQLESELEKEKTIIAKLEKAGIRYEQSI